VDIGGHPPFLTGSKQFSGKFGNLLFLAVFNFWGHFEGPNEGFSRSRFSISGGFVKDEIFVSASNVDCHMASNPSRMRYYVMFPH
jgi:hypothetical protein